MPMIIARREGTLAKTRPMTVATAGATNPAKPPRNGLLRWKTLRTMFGANPPDRPASIHMAATTGAAAENSLRADAGIDTREIIDWAAPEVRVTVSAEASTVIPPRMVSAI